MSDTTQAFNILERRTFVLWSVLILLLIGAPFFSFVGLKATGADAILCGAAPCESPTAPSYVGLNWLALISCASLFGGIGVMMSLILRRNVDAKLSRLGVVQILLIVYGTGAIFALLLLALFAGGLVRGALFPDFSMTGSWRELSFRIPDWGKLVVWSFIAGFSERLMPSFFDQLVDRALASDGDKSS